MGGGGEVITRVYYKYEFRNCCPHILTFSRLHSLRNNLTQRALVDLRLTLHTERDGEQKAGEGCEA